MNIIFTINMNLINIMFLKKTIMLFRYSLSKNVVFAVLYKIIGYLSFFQELKI
jgi:hypothetical protein